MSFAERVFGAVKIIPEGKILSYKEVAVLCGSPRVYRVVGNMLNKNYNPAIPCYRVARSDGHSDNWDRGNEAKIELLRKEKVI